jgi:hypothetical protein
MALKGLKMTFSKKNGKMYQDFVMRSTPKNVTWIVHARKKECKK